MELNTFDDLLALTPKLDKPLRVVLTTANTLLKSWLIHARSTVCGALMGAKVPVAFTSRFVTPEEAYLSIIFTLILHEARKAQE
ncbi:MAG: hypothetical protein J5482_06325 [Oscillospiraceae bacterium]|nr:hypothetical protein [Oscillospiraceae bacterium]